MSIANLKSKNITKNVSLPAAWWDRLDALVAEIRNNDRRTSRSDLIVAALINNQELFLKMEKELDLDPYHIKDLN